MYDFLILLFLELVLGLDNLIFINMIVVRSPRPVLVRSLGITLAVVMRIIALFSADFLLSLDDVMLIWSLSIKNSVLIAGGIFLVVKSLKEIMLCFKGDSAESPVGGYSKGVFGDVLSVVMVDLVFSIDSVTVALAVTREIDVIIGVFIITGIIAFFFLEVLNRLLNFSIYVKVPAMGFIVSMGVKLVLDGVGHYNHSIFYVASLVWLITLLFLVRIYLRRAKC